MILVAGSARPAIAAPPPDAGAPTDFPCKGCIVHVSSRAPTGPRPLLVALHGDGGLLMPIVRAWRAACDEADTILLVPRCPRELGCTTQSYWQWLVGRGHDNEWLGSLVDAMAARYAIDPARIYATGYSGGATYLGWYVPEHPTRFAAVAHVAGGAPLGGRCPACKLPVSFTIGATDPMLDQYTAPLRRFYEACGGHEVTWRVLPGVTHESILDHLQAGRAREILGWLLTKRAACGDEEASDAGASDAGASHAGGFDAGVHDGGAHEVSVVEAPPAPPVRIPPQSGCACRSSRSDAPSSGGPVAATAVAVAAVARRRTRRSSHVDRALRRAPR